MFFPLVTAFAYLLWCQDCHARQVPASLQKQSLTQTKVVNQGSMVVSWQITGTTADDSITFDVAAATKGWVGVGISPSGSMKGADMVVGGVWPNGTAYLWDRHGLANGFPPKDSHNDYTLLAASENETHTTLRFSRKLETCDADDISITNDTLRLLWAYSDAEAVDEDEFAQHDYRGFTPAQFLQYHANDALKRPEDTISIDIKLTNVSIPSRSQTTLYFCQLFELPKLGKHHVVWAEPLIQPGNEAYLHHMVVFQCSRNMSAHVGHAFECLNESPTTYIANFCRNRGAIIWNAGEESISWPEDSGWPVLEDGTSNYFMIETHYDNFKHVEGIQDSSGMRLYLTKNLRKYEAGSLLIFPGHGQHAMIVPPHQGNLTFSVPCTTHCTKTIPHPFYVYGIVPHTHLLGKRIRLRHFRDGKELPLLVEDNNWDFYYERSRDQKPHIKILPGDEFLLECEFNSTERDTTTMNGQATHTEMCGVQLMYYPRFLTLEHCRVAPTNKTHALAMGVRPVERQYAHDENYQIYDPMTNATEDLIYYATQKMRWRADGEKWNGQQRTAAGEALQQAWRHGSFMEECVGISEDPFDPTASLAKASEIDYYENPPLLENFRLTIHRDVAIPELMLRPRSKKQATDCQQRKASLT